MSRIEPNEYFIRVLSRLLEQDFPRAVYRTSEAGALPEISHGAPPGVPRLSICVRGRARHVVRRDGKLAEVKMRAGDVHFILPHCVVVPDRNSRYESVGIVFFAGYTRFVHVNHKGASVPRKSAKEPRPDRVYHAPGLLDPEGRSLCTSLVNSESGEPRDRRQRLRVALLVHSALAALASPGSAAGGKAHLAWQAACEYIREHCHEQIQRDDVAAFLDLHPNHVSRLFAMFSDRSFNSYVRQMRLSHSQRLLRDRALSIKEIAQRSGFASANYYIRAYRTRYGVTPSIARSSKG